MEEKVRPRGKGLEIMKKIIVRNAVLGDQLMLESLLKCHRSHPLQPIYGHHRKLKVGPLIVHAIRAPYAFNEND